MSEDIEELVNNLNTNLTFAIKSTLGPYVHKLNLNNQRYNAVTNILKSLPEYKQMEVEISSFNHEKQMLCNQLQEVITENHMLRKENDFLKNDNISLRKKLEENIHEKAQLQTEVVSNTEATVALHTEVASHKETNIKVVNVCEKKTETETDTDKQVDEKMNVELNVIEKVVENDSDVHSKVKEIYSEVKIDSVNNIVAQSSSSSQNTMHSLSALEKEREIEKLVSELEKHLLNEDEDDEDEDDEDEDEQNEEVEEKTVAEEVAEELANTNELNEKESSVNDYVTSNDEEEEVEEEVEEELFAINIPNFKNEFYTSDKMNGDIYEVNGDDSVGKLLGKFKNGVPIWNMQK
jgi:myosin heavy subunit